MIKAKECLRPTIPNRPIYYYLLLDSANGQPHPYKGTSASSISLSPDSIIDLFQKQVYQDNSTILTGMVSSQLIVYKNKASFDNKENPLRPSQRLLELGTDDEQNDLIVLVPPDGKSILWRILLDLLDYYSGFPVYLHSIFLTQPLGKRYHISSQWSFHLQICRQNRIHPDLQIIQFTAPTTLIILVLGPYSILMFASSFNQLILTNCSRLLL